MEKIAKQIRKNCLRLSNYCKDGNLQSAFSCIDVIWVLYNDIMNWSLDIAKLSERDYFIVSKGQATLALYAVLVEKGIFDMKDMENMGEFFSRYCIQADPTKFNEGIIENAAGSLGHGFPFAVGLAMAAKIKKEPSNIYVLVGDGEFCEGSMWESCIIAATKKLDNLCLIIDDNHSANTMVDMKNLGERLRAFGFEVRNCDGHNLSEIKDTLQKEKPNGKPLAVILDTIRGYGSKNMIEQDIWFHKAPNREELSMLIKEVDNFETDFFR